MARFWRACTALALVPWLVGVTRAAWVALGAGGAIEFRLAAVCGAASWLLYQAFGPKPWWFYVAGHELTHALWARLCGARVSGLRISAAGGRVTVSKSNAWIVLSPYIFPFYTALWVGMGALTQLFVNFDLSLRAVFLFGVGLSYAFHVTFTLAALRRNQPDIAESGRLFSFVFLYLGNGVVLIALLAVIDSHWVKPRDIAWALVDGAGWLVDKAMPRDWR